jgi:uncharacterized repeat protein (TIGR02543 family)
MALGIVKESGLITSYIGADADRHELPYIANLGAKFHNLTYGTVYTYFNGTWYLSDNPLSENSPATTYTKLTAPVVTVGSDGVVSWEAVSNATDYTMIVYTNGVGGTAAKKTSEQVTLTEGQSVEVRANGATVYLTSDYCNKIDYVVPTISYVSRLGTAPDAVENTTGTIPELALALLADTGGFEQEGWYLEPTCKTKATTATVHLNAQHITLYANWQPITYTVTYELDGGTNAATNTTTYLTTKVYELEPATKDGGTFLGWYDAASKGNLVTRLEPGTTKNITLYAYWSLATYTITYVLNGSTNHKDNPATYNADTATITLGDSSKLGYTFNDWYDNAEFTGDPVTQIAKGSYGNVTLYAKLTIKEYTIVYEDGAGTVDAEAVLTFDVDDLPFTLATATQEGYEFGGWYSEIGLENLVPSITVDNLEDLDTAGTITLYAKYNKIYTLAYDFGTLTEVTNPNETISFTVEDLPIALLAPSKENYVFDAWYEEDTYTTPITSLTVENYAALIVTDTVTLYGKLTYSVAVALSELDSNTTTDLGDVAEVLTLTTTFPATINAVLDDVYYLDYKLDFSAIMAGITEGSVSISAITYGGVSLTLDTTAGDILTNQAMYLSEYVTDFARASVVDSENTAPALVVTILNESGSTLTGDVVMEVVVSNDDFVTETILAIDTEQVSIIDVV